MGVTDRVQVTLLADDEFSLRLEGMANHTLKAVTEARRLVEDRDRFNRLFGTDITPDDLIGLALDGHNPLDDLARLMFIHDLHKVVDGKDHAERGADFLSDPVVEGAVRYHDIFGVIHTGEASTLFLEPVVEWIGLLGVGLSRRAKAVLARRALTTLMAATIVDSASYGFLNQARVSTYQQLISVVRRAAAATSPGSYLSTVARHATMERLVRLVQSNNRTSVEPRAMRRALRRALRTVALHPGFEDELARVRFDAGVYVLEPYVRWLVDPGRFAMNCGTPMGVSGRPDVLESFLQRVDACIHCPVHGPVSVPVTRHGIVSLNSLSIKGGSHAAFRDWARRPPSICD